MGCDIHAVIECQENRERYPDEWSAFAVLASEPRWYALFGALTNGEVRGDGFDGSPLLRGFPPKADWETHDAYFTDGDPGKGPDPDWHSPSWVTTDEFYAALRHIEGLDDKYWGTVLKTMNTLEAVGWPCRLVFWFDN